MGQSQELEGQTTGPSSSPAVLEAPNAEAVRDFIHQSDLEHWNNFEFFMASSLDDIMNWIQGLPTIR